MTRKTTSTTAKQREVLELAADAVEQWGTGAAIVVGESRWAGPEATIKALLKKGMLTETGEGRFTITRDGYDAISPDGS